MKPFPLFLFTILAISGCNSGPTADSISGKALKSCLAQVEFTKKLGGKNIDQIVSEQREKCHCSASLMWEKEKESGMSAIWNSSSLDREIKLKCSTESEKKAEAEEREQREKERKALRDFVTNLDKSFR